MKIPNGTLNSPSLFYPAPGLTIAFILYFGLWIIPLIPIDILFSTSIHGRPDYIVFFLSFFTLLGYGGAGIILTKVVKIRKEFKNLKVVLSFLFVTASASFFVSSGIAFTNVIFGSLEVSQITSFVISWFIGDIVGIYSFCPLLIVIIFPILKNFSSKSLSTYQLYENSSEIILIIIICTFFTILIFVQPFFSTTEILFLIFIPLVTISILYGLKGAIFANSLIIFETILLLQYFKESSLLEYQIGIFSLSITALIIGIIITERKEYLNDIEDLVNQRTKQLEEANKDLEFFSYGVSHDLKNPISLIINFSEYLINNETESYSNEQIKIIEKIKSNAESMNYLVEDLLSFFMYSHQPIEKKILDMNNIISSAFESVKEKNVDNNIQFTISPGMPESLGDPILIKIVWTNLISNAIKYSSKQNISIIDVGYEIKENNKILYYIKDNGIGIQQKDLTKIFNVFQRLHTESEYSGKGVGLTLVKKIILRHGGDIWIDSELKKGSTFYFTLS